MRIRLIVATTVAVGAIACAAACSTPDSRMNGLAMNLAGPGVGDTTLHNAGLKLKDDLECKSTPGSGRDGLMSIECTSETVDNQKVRLFGTVTKTANDAHGKGVTNGDFTVTVGGRVYLKTHCLGACPSPGRSPDRPTPAEGPRT
ncbi:hypothetical protein [Streptomyces sp. cg36]|uniref:hypothetical protein n=1 Tax=Streptomyces sp. cg36 TaxID=3238798 RepID=UPI0034E1D1DC